MGLIPELKSIACDLSAVADAALPEMKIEIFVTDVTRSHGLITDCSITALYSIINFDDGRGCVTTESTAVETCPWGVEF
jgi:hypothetical protein